MSIILVWFHYAWPHSMNRSTTNWWIKMYKILDVGCGNKPKGDVNVDFLLYDSACGHRIDSQIDSKHIPNFIVCDAHCLPFRDNAFNVVRASHVIEHLKQPYLAVQEFKRVTRRFVYIHVPDAKLLFRERSTHLFSWHKQTLENFLLKIFPHVTVYSTLKLPVHGRLLDRMMPLKRLLTFLIKTLLPGQLTAICQK